ncbi:MAG: sulfotransferase [Ilumatobacteraceae bacterium]|nr:sulfotransferase [Ilumatobacteraceae bacterium]
MERYGSERSERWDAFEHRPGDIVVSTRSKCGTTWMQMICLLLIHGAPLPGPLSLLSPWLDWDVEPEDVVHARLAAQRHRRVIKTHTPLDGIPLDPDVRYIVVGRHSLDVALSLYHHVGNIDQERSSDLRNRAPVAARPRATVDEWMSAWIDDRRAPTEELDTLAGNVHHIADAWNRTGSGNVLLVHYADLLDDGEAAMRQIARWLDIEVPDHSWTSLADAASFDSMRVRANETAPDHLGVLKDRGAFFRSGTSGEGLRACSTSQRRRCDERVSDLTAPPIASWLGRC